MRWLVLLVLAGCLTPAPGEYSPMPPGDDATWMQIAWGSAIDGPVDAGVVVVRDAETWQAVRATHQASSLLPYSPDFDTEALVVVRAGSRDHSGHEIVVTGVEDGTVHATIIERIGECRTYAYDVSPFVILSIPAATIVRDVAWTEAQETCPWRALPPQGMQTISDRDHRPGLDDWTYPKIIVIDDQAAWEAFWLHHSPITYPPDTSPPPVDFNASFVVAALMGGRPSGGFSVAVADVIVDDALYVEADLSRAGMGCILTAAFTSPMQVVAVQRPAGDLPPPRVLWTEHVTDCTSRSWEVLESGHTSGHEAAEPTMLLIRDLASWHEFWHRHASSDPPPVDFASAVVVAVLAGPRPDLSQRVEVTHVHGNATLLVHAMLHGDCVASDLMSSPYTLLLVERRAQAPQHVSGRWTETEPDC